MEFTDLLQLVVYGVVYGAILTLGAIGVSLLFGILRFANFAHGDLMTVGAYGTFVGVSVFGLSPWAALPIGIALAGVVAVTADRLVYRRLRRTQPVILLISSFGIALILRSLVTLIWGSKDRVYEAGIKIPLRIGDIMIRPDHLWILAATVALVIGLQLFLKKTRIGMAMRALSDNMDLARVTGIDAERVILWTWVIGGGLAAIAGVFLAMDTRLYPHIGFGMLLPIFAAAILGGIGSPWGAIVGGMAIGIISEVSTAFISPAYKPAIAFTLMVLMLIIRPTGLVGGRK